MDDIIELRGHIRVPRAALELALALEHAGHRLSVTPTRRLHVSAVSGHELPASDQEAIRRWKPDLIVIAQYRADDYAEEESWPPLNAPL